MSPEATSAAQRAYDEIKQRIRDGRLPVRTRIDIESLARELNLSSMPVRQALNLLTGEHIVRPGKHSAYEVSLWSEAELAQLYEWRGALLALTMPFSASGPELKRVVRTQVYAEAVYEVMRLIEVDANSELRRAAINADERLWPARQVENEILGDVDDEFATLVSALADRSRRAAALLKAYTRRRVQRARDLRAQVVLRAIPNNGAKS